MASFESRRATDIVRLVERYGGACLSAPSMREVPLEAPTETRELVERLRQGRVDLMLFLTGVGARALAKAVAPYCPHEELVRLLTDTAVMVRGPKPTAVMKEWHVPIALVAPEPNTWREVLAALDGAPRISRASASPCRSMVSRTPGSTKVFAYEARNSSPCPCIVGRPQRTWDLCMSRSPQSHTERSRSLSSPAQTRSTAYSPQPAPKDPKSLS